MSLKAVHSSKTLVSFYHKHSIKKTVLFTDTLLRISNLRMRILILLCSVLQLPGSLQGQCPIGTSLIEDPCLCQVHPSGLQKDYQPWPWQNLVCVQFLQNNVGSVSQHVLVFAALLNTSLLTWNTNTFHQLNSFPCSSNPSLIMQSQLKFQQKTVKNKLSQKYLMSLK